MYSSGGSLIARCLYIYLFSVSSWCDKKPPQNIDYPLFVSRDEEPQPNTVYVCETNSSSLLVSLSVSCCWEPPHILFETGGSIAVSRKRCRMFRLLKIRLAGPLLLENCVPRYVTSSPEGSSKICCFMLSLRCPLNLVAVVSLGTSRHTHANPVCRSVVNCV